MKKIMKKALGIVLTLALVIVLAPMVTKASQSMTGDLAVDGSTNTILFDGDEAYVCTWTPEKDTTYTFKFLESDWVIEFSSLAGNDAFGSFNCSSGVFSYDVYAGVTYTITILNTTWQADDINFYVEEGSAEPQIQGSGTEYDPYVVPSTMQLPEIAYGQTAYYIFADLAAAADYTLTVMGGARMDAFNVAIPYTENAAQSAMGMASLQVTSSYRGTLMFAITNYNRGTSGPYTLTLEPAVQEAQPGETPENPIQVNPDEPYVNLPTGSGMVYYAVSVEAGEYYTFTFSTRQFGVEYDAYFYNGRLGSYCYYGTSVNGYLEVVDLMLYAESDTLVFALANCGDVDAPIFINAVKYEENAGGDDSGEEGGEEGGEDTDPLGSYSNMDSLEFDYSNPTDIVNGEGHWYTLPEIIADGMISIYPGSEEDCPAGFYVDIYVEGAEGYDWITGYDGMDSFDFNVTAGAKVAIFVHNSAFDFDSDVNFTVYYTEGASASEGGEGEDIAYEFKEDTILSGTNSYELSSDKFFTVFEFVPSEAGIYTITSDNAFLGIVGYYYIDDANINDIVISENEIIFTAQNEYNTFYLGVWSEYDFPANITVTREDLQEVVVNRTEYENEAAPEEFTNEIGEDDEIVYFADLDETPVIVKGDDGFYYTEDGKLVLAHIGTGAPIVPLAELPNYGQAKYYVTDTEMIDYNAAVLAYVAIMDANGFVPVTDDIIEFYTNVGAFQGWYTAGGIAEGYDYTFAFAYVNVAEDDESIKDTGDTTAYVIGMIVLLGGALLVTGFVSKKRAF